MKKIKNTSKVIDNSVMPPVIYSSNTVQTIIKRRKPPFPNCYKCCPTININFYFKKPKIHKFKKCNKHYKKCFTCYNKKIF